MDYCEDFRILQTVLNHCNEFVKNFNKLEYYGGNEVYVKEIAARLLKHLRTRGYVTNFNTVNVQFKNELRKITFVMMLNTDVTLKYDLNNDPRICHILNNFEQLTKCLLISLVWELRLDEFFYETLEYSNSWFVLQFLHEAADSNRHQTPIVIIERVKCMVNAIYSNICRMDYRPASNQVDKKIVLGKFFDYIMDLLRHYNTPNTELETITKKKEKEYLGHSLNSLITLVLSCFHLYQHKPPIEDNNDLQIYKLMLDQEPEIDNYSSTYSNPVDDTLMKINIALLNTLQNSVLNITLDHFVYWVEVDIEDEEEKEIDLKIDNLQKAIGVSAYNLTQIMSLNECFQHDLINQLQCLSIKPKQLHEIAKAATVGTVLEKIESSINKRVWLQELLNRSQTLFQNTECLQTVLDNISMINIKDLLKIAREYQNYQIDEEDEQIVHAIFRSSCQYLNKEEITEFIEELINVLGVDYDIHGETKQLEQEITNYLNKLTLTSLNVEQMFKLLLLNPQLFYNKLMDGVAEKDYNQIQITLKLISESSSIAAEFIETLIIDNLLASPNAKSTTHFFIHELFKLELLNRKEFIIDLIMDPIAKALLCKEYEKVLVLLNALKLISSNLKIDDMVAPLLILLSHVMDQRWDLISYSQMMESIVEVSVAVILNLLKIILVKGNKKDKDWILGQIENSKPMTKFYFQKLSLEKSEPILTFAEYLHPEGFETSTKSKKTAFLCENLVRCTTRECRWFAKNKFLQQNFTDALLVITVIVSKSHDGSPINCLRKCVSDYVKILTESLIPSSIEQDSEFTLLKDVASLINKFPPQLFEDLTMLFVEPMKQFFNTAVAKNELNRSCFIDSISQVNECQLKKMLLEYMNTEL
ncbi:unnamed protein product [Diamesa serratosioi]